VQHLVVADPPVGQHAALASATSLETGLGPVLGHGFDRLDRHTAAIEQAQAIDHLLWGVPFFDALDVFAPTAGVLVEPVLRHHGLGILCENHVRDRVQIGNVAVQRLEVERVARIDVLESLNGTGPPRIGNQRGNVGLLLVIGHAPEQHGVRRARIVPPERNHVGVFEIHVAGRRRVGTVGREVAGDRRGHAHARVGLDRVRSDDSLEQQVLDPLRFHRQLAGTAQADGVAAVLLDDRGHLVGNDRFGFFVGDFLEDIGIETPLGGRFVPAVGIRHVFAHQRPGNTVAVDRLVGVQAFDALHAFVRRVQLVRRHADNSVSLDVDQRAAADTAVRAGREHRAPPAGQAEFFEILGMGELPGEGLETSGRGDDAARPPDEVPAAQTGDVRFFHCSFLLGSKRPGAAKTA